MKRIICAILALLCLTSAALAENMDFSAYTTDQLIDMIALIQSEIENRTSGLTSSIPYGYYAVGKDIAAGSYELTKNEETDDVIAVILYVSEEKRIQLKKNEIEYYDAILGDYRIRTDDDTICLNLEDSNYLLIEGNGCLIKPVSYSWQP